MGDPEGSPRDPLTTDPKGEARHTPESPEIHAARNTPALIRCKRRQWHAVLADYTVDCGKAIGRGKSA
jgi:hypothetical protein